MISASSNQHISPKIFQNGSDIRQNSIWHVELKLPLEWEIFLFFKKTGFTKLRVPPYRKRIEA